MALTRPPAPRRLRTGALVLSAAVTSVMVTPSLLPSADASPSLTTTGPTAAAGAVPVDTSISSPPRPAYPSAPKSATGCRYPDVTAPNGLPI